MGTLPDMSPRREPGTRPEVGSTGAARTTERAVRAAALTRRRVDDALVVLSRLVPLARRISRAVLAYAVLVGIAAVAIVVTAVWTSWPLSATDGVVVLVLAAVLGAPAVVLFLFQRALDEVVRIPSQLGAMPDVARTHGTELAALLRDAQARRGRVRLVALPGDLWRAGRLLLAAHDDLPGYGAVLALMSVPFLLVALLAAVVGAFELMLAPVVVLVAVASTLI